MQTKVPDIPYIDIHNHGQHAASEDLWQITNILYQDAVDHDGVGTMFSIGLHPWHTEGIHFNADLFRQLISHQNIAAAGETGLDRLKGSPIETQIQLFLEQVRAADEVNKPVIIHCVRSWGDLLQLKQIAHPRVPWIIHGFRGKPELAIQLISKGFYLSFGDVLLKKSDPALESFQVAPIKNIFFETDESDIPIREIYMKAAELRDISLLELKMYIADNFERIFGIYEPS